MTSKEMQSTVKLLEQRFAEKYAPTAVGERNCYKLPDGSLFAVATVSAYKAYVLEYAESIDAAKLNQFEDGDLFYLNDSLDAMFNEMCEEISQ